MGFKRLVEKRRSTRRFMLGKAPDWRKIIRALDTALYIPTAGNIYNLKFILISDPEIIDQIAQACGQDFISDAPHVVVMVSDEEKMEKMFAERGRRYSAQMAGSAIQNFLLALTEAKLDTVWIGHFYDDMIKGLLNIPDDNIVEGIFPVGYASKMGGKKDGRRRDLENFLFFGEWGTNKMEPTKRLNADSV